jgi:hypothetical protein
VTQPVGPLSNKHTTIIVATGARIIQCWHFTPGETEVGDLFQVTGLITGRARNQTLSYFKACASLCFKIPSHLTGGDTLSFSSFTLSLLFVHQILT